MYKLVTLQDLGRFELSQDSDGERILALKEAEQLREKASRRYSKLSEMILPKPARFNACFYEFVEGMIRVSLGYRYASTISSRAFFEHGGENFEFPYDGKKNPLEQVELELRHRTIRAVILRNPRNAGSIIGHSFPF